MKSRLKTIGFLTLFLFLSFLVQPIAASGYGGSQTITDDFIPFFFFSSFHELIFQIQESFSWDNNTWQTNEWHLLGLTLQVTTISPNIVDLQVNLDNISFYLMYPNSMVCSGASLSTVNFAPAQMVKIQSSSVIYNVPQGISNRAVQYIDSNNYPYGTYMQKELCYSAVSSVSFTYRYPNGSTFSSNPSYPYPFGVSNQCTSPSSGPCYSVPITVKPLWTTPTPSTDYSWFVIPITFIAVGAVGVSFYIVEKRKRGIIQPIQPITPSTIFCKNCGQKMTPNLKFCTQCGTPLT